MTGLERIFTADDKSDLREAFKEVLVKAFESDLKDYLENEYMFDNSIIDEILEEIQEEVKSEIKLALKEKLMKKALEKIESL